MRGSEDEKCPKHLLKETLMSPCNVAGCIVTWKSLAEWVAVLKPNRALKPQRKGHQSSWRLALIRRATTVSCRRPRGRTFQKHFFALCYWHIPKLVQPTDSIIGSALCDALKLGWQGTSERILGMYDVLTCHTPAAGIHRKKYMQRV